MFLKRLKYKSGRKYDKAFFVKLVSDLKSSKFDEIKVKLPFGEGLKPEGELAPEEFLERNRNYPCIILIARNTENRDGVKILFVNTSKKVFFSDDTFPSGYSEPPEVYVESEDPVRLSGLSNFFVDYLHQTPGRQNVLAQLLFLPVLLFVLTEILSVFQNRRLVLQSKDPKLILLDLILILVSAIIVLAALSRETGLYIKERENRILEFTKRAVKGDFRDNPIVTFIVAFLATFLAGLILWLLKLI